jgi:hypothetical protein
MVCLAQTVHLSCTDSNTISKWTKMRFQMTHVTLEFHWVHPKWFLRLWYVWHKPCTYLASRLALSLNGLNQASTWASSPRSTIGCVQNNFGDYGTFGANGAPILRQDCHYLRTNWIKQPLEPRHLRVPSGASKTISDPLVRSAQTMHLSCVKISTISNELNQASTWASSPRSTIGCVQSDFWDYGMFSTNRAPILNRQKHYLQMGQNEIPHDPRCLGVPLGVSKIISEAMVRSALTMHLSCLKISTIFEQTELSFHLSLVT